MGRFKLIELISLCQTGSDYKTNHNKASGNSQASYRSELILLMVYALALKDRVSRWYKTAKKQQMRR